MGFSYNCDEVFSVRDTLTGLKRHYYFSYIGLTPLPRERSITSDSGRSFRPTLSLFVFLSSICNITEAAFVHSDAFSSACHRQKDATPRSSLNHTSSNSSSDDFHYENLSLKLQ